LGDFQALTVLRRRHLLLGVVLALTIAGALHADESIDASQRLAALAKVWGLLKYFDPAVARGSIDWDTMLVTEIPRVESAATKAEFNDELMRFIASAGPQPAVRVGAALDQPESDPVFVWIDDAALFDESTTTALKIVRNASLSATNRFVKGAINVGNPDFSSEDPRSSPAYPSREVRLLTLFRYWNMVQYYYPDRDLIDGNWSDVLVAKIPEFVGAADLRSYNFAVSRLTAAITDTHASVPSGPAIIDYFGVNMPGLRIRNLESQTVVTQLFNRFTLGADVRVGDIIADIDGEPATDRRERFRPFVSGSNEPALQRIIDSYMLRTNATSIDLGVLRDGVRNTVRMSAFLASTVLLEMSTQDALQPKWKVLDGNIGYVNMGLLQQSDVAAMMNALRSTRAIVFDVRNYPNNTLYLIAEQLNPRSSMFVRFTQPNYAQPGTFVESASLSAGPLTSTATYYRGQVILLADERTQSHAEFTLMALKTAPDVTLVGSQTAGADGNVSLITLPGGMQTYFSGFGVYFPDGRNTQRIGIVPDVEVHPTIAGVAAGVDEVLQRALALVR
jgi:C-terminal processing protease CtpA/Prc